MKQESCNNYENLNLDSSTAKQTKKRFFTKGRIKVLSIISAVIVVGAIILNLNMLFPWQWSAKENKKAALNYIEEHFPTAEIVDVDYKSMIPGWMSVPIDTFYLKLDGIEFTLITQKGKVLYDTYYDAKADKYICENFINDFMNERGLSPKIKISYFGGIDEELTDFKWDIGVYITQAYIDGASTPKHIDWFYDFYCYWMDNCDLPNCAVSLTYLPTEEINTNMRSYNVWFQKGEKIFANEDEFYKSFR